MGPNCCRDPRWLLAVGWGGSIRHLRDTAMGISDSSAAVGMCSRQGLGKVRHLDAQSMWIQQRVRRGDVDLCKVRGDDNLADIFTKPLPRDLHFNIFVVDSWAKILHRVNISLLEPHTHHQLRTRQLQSLRKNERHQQGGVLRQDFAHVTAHSNASCLAFGSDL